MISVLSKAAAAARQTLVLCFVAAASLFFGVAAYASTPTPAEPEPFGMSTYRLAAGDVISIRVFGEDDLSKDEVRLTDAGTIFYPVVGEIRALGLTLGDTERIIADRLRGRILVNPRVSVSIKEYRPFYINGMVHRPGGYPFQPGLTVRKAASVAGGFRERASMSRIFLIQEQDPNKRPRRVELDTPVGPGDIITIEESFF